MPYYPGGGSGDEVHYRLNTKGEKLVIDYLNITIFDVQEMPIDLYLYFMPMQQRKQTVWAKPSQRK